MPLPGLKKLEPKERLFVAILKMSEKEKDVKYLTNSGIAGLGDYLGIDLDICSKIRNRYLKKYKVSPNKEK